MYDVCTPSTHTFNVYTEVQSELRCQQSSTCILQKYLPGYIEYGRLPLKMMNF